MRIRMNLLLRVNENVSAFYGNLSALSCHVVRGLGAWPCAQVHRRGHDGGCPEGLESAVGRRVEM